MTSNRVPPGAGAGPVFDPVNAFWPPQPPPGGTLRHRGWRCAKIDLPALEGSWAGAFGLPQFIPSSYWGYAVDGNGDFVVNYWGEQRIFSHVDGHEIQYWSASAWYPGSSGYYWYVTF